MASLSESRPVRCALLARLQVGQASARSDESSAPPRVRGMMCSRWKVTPVIRCGARPILASPPRAALDLTAHRIPKPPPSPAQRARGPSALRRAPGVCGHSPASAFPRHGPESPIPTVRHSKACLPYFSSSMHRDAPVFSDRSVARNETSRTGSSDKRDVAASILRPSLTDEGAVQCRP